MNMESSLSVGNKLKLKIKLGGDDASGPESGSEMQSPMQFGQDLEGTSGLTEEQLARKIKKKKKKKHKHKDRKDKEFDQDKGRRLSTDGSVPPSPFDSYM